MRKQANAIGTAYLRADVLPEKTRQSTQALLRDHVDLRVKLTIANSCKEQTLLTIVKLRYADMPPIPPKLVLFLMQSGWPVDMIFPIVVESINGLRSRTAAGTNQRIGDPEYYYLVKLLRKIQKSGAVGMRVIKGKARRNRMRIMVKRLAIVVLMVGLATPSGAQEVIVLAGLDETIDWLKSENWWGEEKHEEQLTVPRAMIAGISQRWQKNAPNLPVPVKKEIFYRFLLPLVVHANTMVLDRRERLQGMANTLKADGKLSPEDDVWLREVAVVLRIADRETVRQINDPAELDEIIDQALYKLDVIPAGLALGQAAYESGYGTSRFAVEGNALFGQWTFGGEGLVPEQQRKALGDHRIASFEWPFDSVRGYFINLSSHPAYEDFRRIRAERKASGKPLTSLALADGLKNYSERGQAYVDTLKSVIRVNKLAIADDAVFRDESMRFVIGAADPAAAKKLREDIEAMRKSGKLNEIIERMRLE